MLVAEGAGMTSGNDDLEQELRRNLKLRRELGAQAAKGKAALSAKQDGGFAYRLGWVLYWVCLALSLGWAAIGLYAGVQRPSNFSNVITMRISYSPQPWHTHSVEPSAMCLPVISPMRPLPARSNSPLQFAYPHIMSINAACSAPARLFVS